MGRSGAVSNAGPLPLRFEASCILMLTTTAFMVRPIQAVCLREWQRLAPAMEQPEVEPKLLADAQGVSFGLIKGHAIVECLITIAALEAISGLNPGPATPGC